MTTTPTTQADASVASRTGHASDAVLRVAGELNHATVLPLSRRLQQALTTGPGEVVVDLEECTFVDATALAELVETNTAAQRAGRTLVLRRCSPRVERLLALTGLRRVFTVRP